MFGRKSLLEALEAYRKLCGRRGRYEFFFWLGVFAVASAGLYVYMQPPDPVMGVVYGFGMAGCALVGALVHRAIDHRCRREAGLVCPKCRGTMTERGALHVPLTLACEHCGGEIYA